MRRLAFLFFVGLAALVVAGPRPLSTKDISLMLRSGYSSENVLQEIEQRRVLETPDSATKQSLIDLGASAQLVSALESGKYQVDAAEAERVRAAAAAATTNQLHETEQTLRRAVEVLKEQQAQAATTGQRPLNVSLVSMLKDKVVRNHDGIITPVDAHVLERKKLIAFYYSAHWCAPCRKFTPELVDYYNRIVATHPEFELIFVSADKSRFNWETYIRGAKMPWLAIDFDQLGGFDQLRQLGGASIPSLLVVNEQSRVVASSYEGEKYMGPQYAVAVLDQLLAAAGTAAK